MEKVYVGYPHGGKVDGAFTKSLLDLQRFEDRNPTTRYELLDIEHAPGLYVPDNRNTLVRMAQASGADWLLQLDGDETFDPMLLRLIMRTSDKDTRPIIAGLYANIGNIGEQGSGSVSLVDMIFGEMPDGSYVNLNPPENLQPFLVDAVGAGILLTHLSVFEKMAFPWFFDTYISTIGQTGKVVVNFLPPMGKQFMNEDIAFCRMARESGFEIWCDPIAQAVHWKTLPISPSTLRSVLDRAEKFRREVEQDRTKANMQIPGWISEEECMWLYDQASKVISVVEIGSWMGRSTYSLLKGCKGTVFAVDHFNGSPSELETNHREAKSVDIYKNFIDNVGGFQNLRVLKKDSAEAAKEFTNGSIEMVFLDGEHTEESFVADIKAWTSKCSKLLCGHDRDIEGVKVGLEKMGIPFREGPGSIWYTEIN